MKLKKKIAEGFKNNAALIEIAVGFLMIEVVNRLLFSENLGFLQVGLHPYWIIVLLAACRYGFKAGLVSGAIAMFLYGAHLFEGLPSRNLLEQAAEEGAMWLGLAFFIVGMMMGEICQQSLTRQKHLREELSEKKRDYTQAVELFEQSERARTVLEGRIVGQTATLKTLYTSTRKLESGKAEEAYQGCLDILEKYLNVEAAAIYLKIADDLVLKASRGLSSDEALEGKFPLQKSVLRAAFEENRIIRVRDLLAQTYTSELGEDMSKFLALIPLQKNKQCIGVLVIKKMPFMALNHHNLELIHLVIDWMSQAIDQIEQFESLKKHTLYNAQGLYTHTFFQKSIEYELKRAKHFGIELSMALLKINQFGLVDEETQQLLEATLISLLNKNLPDTELTFEHRFSGNYIILAPHEKKNTVEKNLQRIQKDFSLAKGKLDYQLYSLDENPEELEKFLVEA